MREVILDTETTGFSPASGDKIVEIGALEMVDRELTGRQFHEYLNPGRPVPRRAQAIHGLSDSFLADKPLFDDVAQDMLDFIGDDTIVIHNAPFDLRFLNAELMMSDLPCIPWGQAHDTVARARELFPGERNTLDSLCWRYGIDTSLREEHGHGALVDCHLLAQVHQHMGY